MEGEKQKKIIARLQIEKDKILSTISGLQDEVTLLTSKLDDNMTKYVRMLNTGFDMLDEILQVGKGSRNFTGVGFNYQSINKQGGISMAKFVSPESNTGFLMSNQMSQHLVQLQKTQTKVKFVPWKCHYCGR